jgi:GT2 family glycosyltransferase
MRFSVCICTRNRPDDLQKALKSVQKSHIPIHEVIVSDDSTDLRTKEVIRSFFPDVIYLEGPKKGLSANRNNAIRGLTGTHVLFMDDDVILAGGFFTTIKNEVQDLERRHGNKIIITGLENKNGSIIYPHDQTFLGFQSRKYKDGEALKTIVINSTVFPANLFKEILFDEQLIYGYEEVDIATRAVQKGYYIHLADEAINYHFPSDINRDFYKPHVETSRIYATFKRYLYTERKWLKALSFFMVAFIHTMRHGMKAEGKKGIVKALWTIGDSLRMVRRQRNADLHGK